MESASFGKGKGRTAGDVPVFGTSPAPSPNSRTEMPVLRAERVIAVRHRPISALGARGWAFLLPIGGADVRLFGGKGEIPPPPGEGNHASTELWTTKMWKTDVWDSDVLSVQTERTVD